VLTVTRIEVSELLTHARSGHNKLRYRFVDCPLISKNLDDPAILDGVRKEFAAEKLTARYRAAFREHNPLVTVCITTSDRGELLAERALTSMVRQTYTNLQVIIVGDQCEDDTAERISSFNDSRFQYFNLHKRGPYPSPGYGRWCVAGAYPANEALRRATGAFITELDEDDTFEDDRIEILVSAIQSSEADLVYHPFWWEDPDSTWRIIGDGTFQLGQTGTSMVLYHHWFARIPCDVMAFKKNEPGDWNRFRNFLAVGAKTQHVPNVLTRHFRYPARAQFEAKAGERYLDQQDFGSAINELARETYEAMLELIEEPSNNSFMRTIDVLRARFDIATSIFYDTMRGLEEDIRRTRSHPAAERDESAANLAAQRDEYAGHLATERNEFALQLKAANGERDSLLDQIGEASLKIARAESIIAHIANRYSEKSRVSKRIRFRDVWGAWSKKRKLSFVNSKDVAAIRNSVFFDEGHYLETYPDVRAAGVDAALHYLVCGCREGRDPGPFFSTHSYFARNSDVQVAGLNALLHYETYGRGENRRIVG